MDDLWMRIAENLGDRVSGPMKFRVLVQPAVAVILAVMAGLKDARAGKPPYLWWLATRPEQRMAMLKDGWQDVGKVFMLAVVLDVIYQWIVQRFVYPGEVIIVAFVLAIVPYLLLRGLVNRIARRK